MLEPRADGFRNYLRSGAKLSPETLLLDRAYLLNLTAPEMTVLLGGMRAPGTNIGRSEHGVFTDRRETLSNDFFVNLLAPGTEWKASETAEDSSRSATPPRGTSSGRPLPWTWSSARLPAPGDLGGLRQRRRAGEFVHDFVAAWVKVMELDRFDLR